MINLHEYIDWQALLNKIASITCSKLNHNLQLIPEKCKINNYNNNRNITFAFLDKETNIIVHIIYNFLEDNNFITKIEKET